MTGTPSGTNTAMADTAAQPPAMDTIPTAGSILATQQQTFSAKGARQGTRQRSEPQCNGTVSTRRLPIRVPAHATPATAATTARTGRISTATTNAIREPTPSPHQLLVLLVPWVYGQGSAQRHDVRELHTGTPDQLNSPKNNGRESGGGTPN